MGLQHFNEKRHVHFKNCFLFSSSTFARCLTEETLLITSGIHRDFFFQSEIISQSTKNHILKTFTYIDLLQLYLSQIQLSLNCFYKQ